MEHELWLPVKGYEGIYDVSNLGRVRRNFRIVFRNGSKGYCQLQSKFLHKSRKKNNLSSDIVALGRTARCTVGRLVAEAFIPNPLNLPVVTHINFTEGDKVSNLRWTLKSEACSCAGKLKNPTCVLTKSDVLNIRKKYIYRTNIVKLAKKYNVTTGTIRNIVKRRSWKYI